ncbi:MAG: FKBP-type peptidyl-prolyl cis-trans isomerase [Alphaproteobacteria bacterium]|nr:FKBP-type peptidyl-prolyl cis-trans isomerase [Alphaproteobacteria bacterium]
MKLLAAALAAASLATLAPAAQAQGLGSPVILPGVRYQVLASGPANGRHPTRADTVEIRYVGRLLTSEIFSTSDDHGRRPSPFKVGEVIPGMSAALQLMRPGDRWRVIIPAYLGYGATGRAYRPPVEHLIRDVPPDATLVFDVELVSIRP